VTEKRHEWNPLSEEALNHQIAAYDRVRSRCPVAHSEQRRSVVRNSGKISNTRTVPTRSRKFFFELNTDSEGEAASTASSITLL
jgi:hypothetical protein